MWMRLVLTASFISYVCSFANVLQNTEQCVVLNDINIDSCPELKKYKSLSRRNGNVNGFCPNNTICGRNFSISYIRRQLYSVSILREISNMFDRCCNNCTSYHISNILLKVSEINSDVLSSSDFIYPFLGSRSLTEMYGAYYVPVFYVPTAYYITLKPTANEKMRELFFGCISTWPLIVICIILSIISGFVIWNIERRENTMEFPKRFHKGLYEGFWWSFISMTTVGYGDRSPKTFPGRIFAVFWVLIGITMFSILTGELTNQISAIQAEPSEDLLGKTVGGLTGKLHDITMTIQHSGFFTAIPFNDTVHGVTDLIEMLSKKEIDGFLINRITYYYYRWAIATYPYRYNKRVFKMYREVPLYFNEKDFVGEKKTVGILIKDRDVYMYFKRYFEDNMLQLENCNAYHINKKGVLWKKVIDEQQMGKSFLTMLYPSLVLVGVIILVGIVIEIRRRFFRKEQKKHCEEEETHLEEIAIKDTKN